MVVTIEMSGRKFMLLNGGPEFTFNPSISFFVLCETADEIEQYYKAIMKDGSELMPLDTYDISPKYAWVDDRFGISWQIVPVVLRKLLADPSRSDRVTEAFLKMRKFNIEELVNA